MMKSDNQTGKNNMIAKKDLHDRESYDYIWFFRTSIRKNKFFLKNATFCFIFTTPCTIHKNDQIIITIISDMQQNKEKRLS